MYYLILLSTLLLGVFSETCYWNRQCPYQLYSSKTPYDSIRGDIRDIPLIEGCEAVSVWTLNRHGNRNPGSSVTLHVKAIGLLKDDIISSFEAGTSELCSQDIDLFKKWTWNETMETSTSYLTGIGYEEIFDIAQRIRQKYPYLLEGSSPDDFYFRPTNEQRTIVSAVAFVHGLTEGLDLNLTADAALDRDDLIRPYQNCDRYQEEVRNTSTLVDDHIAVFEASDDFQSVKADVQRRLGIAYQLTDEDTYSFYELCRFDRSWNEKLQSPWCSVFSDEDLVILEYRDDIRHYYRNGYGHWTNPRLGGPALHHLYNMFLSVYQGQTRKITSFFTHDTMLEMTFAAMGLYKDDFAILGDNRKEARLWRTSFIGALSTNIIAVLNRCNQTNAESYNVQFFINEKESEVCSLSGCSWSEFTEKFSEFSANLDFCSLDYPVPEVTSTFATAASSSSRMTSGFFVMLLSLPIYLL